MSKLSESNFLERAREKHGDTYDYSEVRWVSSTDKVTIICPQHGRFSQTPTRHATAGQGCPRCRGQRAAKQTRKTTEDAIKDLIRVHGDKYDFSKVVYKGSKEKVEVVCPEHGSFWATPGNLINRASGCPGCRSAAISERSRIPEEVFIERFREAHGDRFQYIGVYYEDSVAFVDALCPIHGRFSQRAMDHQKGMGCKKCVGVMYDTESFVEAANKVHGNRYDYSNVNYTGALTKVEILCKTHGPFHQTPNSHVSDGQGCRMCGSSGPSKGQLEIYEFVSQFANAELDARISGRKEVDILVKGKGLALEFDGLIWHSTKYGRKPFNIKEKNQVAKQAGIRLIHIFQDEWEFKRPIVEKTLKSFLGVDVKTYARSLGVVEVGSAEAKKFYDTNHLQGGFSGPASHLGLFNKSGDMVACMSLSRVTSIRGGPSNNEEYELRRYASTKTVVGGAAKLFSNFLRKLNPSKVISYSDNRIFTGTMYQHLGFSKLSESTPDYYYVTSSSRKRHNKVKFQRKFLPELFGDRFDPSKSESENCEENGWFRLYDCGKTKWAWTK